MENTKYESVEKLIELPQRRHILPVHESLFLDSRQLQRANVSTSIKQGRAEFIQTIERQLEVFDDANTFVFKFPDSKFPSVPIGESNRITYEQKMDVIQQDTFKDKLSPQQIVQMKEKGEFQVKSNMKNVSIPYVWKINDTLLRGRVNIINIWQNGLAWCYGQLYDSTQNFKEVIPRCIQQIKVIPKSFFTLIFGRRSLSEVYSPNYNRQVYKDFWADIFDNQLKDISNEVSHQFLQLLYLKYEPALYEQVKKSSQMKKQELDELQSIRNKKVQEYNNSLSKKYQLKQRLADIENRFQSNWLKVRRRILTKISNQVAESTQKITDNEEELLRGEVNNKKDEQILDKLNKEKYLIYTAHLKQNLPKQNFSPKCIQALTFLITLISIFQSKMQIKNEKLRKQKDKIVKDIENKHRIKSKHWRFKNDLINQIYQPICQQIQNEFYERLLQENSLDKLFPVRYQSVYTKYLTLKKNFDSLLKQKQGTLKKIYIPERVFKSTYMLLPPYQVVNTNGYFSLKRQVQMYIDTSTNFWKFKLYAMRIKCWTINCAIFLLGFSWVGPLGLRCLYGAQPFKYDEYCQYDTGLKQYQYRKPFLAVFMTVLDGIRQSRKHFQALPDRGLFGKKFSRYFNYCECYIFRLFFVGVVGVLILYPILIVSLSALSIVLVFTIWFWVPIIMAVCYLFNILVFQFESSYNYHAFKTKGLPLIRIIWIIIGCLLSIIYSLLRLIISPIVCVFYTLILLIQRGFRTFTDKVMLFLISKLGRTPSRDTSIARKISGPGMSRSYFYSINEQDVYVLTLSSLQKIFVDKFLSLTREKIQSSTKKYNQIMNFVLSPFGYTYPSLPFGRNVVTENKNRLLERFTTQSNQYLARYPNRPNNIRFTEQELDQYFDNSVKIVKNFVERQEIQSWVFSEKNVLDEDYEQLTRVIWIQIFNCGEQIFQPLETIDGRFRISEEVTTNTIKMRQNIGSVMKALQGQIKLSHRAPNFNPAKISLLDKDVQISILRKICGIHNENNGINIELSLSDPSYILIPQRNLEELQRYDSYMKNQILERYDKKFEE